MIMKQTITALLILILCFTPKQITKAQYKEKNYGKTPKEMIPYARYQDAYVKHFLEPIAFTGAGREKGQTQDDVSTPNDAKVGSLTLTGLRLTSPVFSITKR